MKKARYLFPQDYMADPAANVFNGKVFIYPSHDWDSGAAEDDDGGHFEMWTTTSSHSMMWRTVK